MSEIPNRFKLPLQNHRKLRQIRYINNAGVGITGPLEEIPSEEIKNNFETNLFGPIEVMKAALPQMRTQNQV
jgi:short-subunit dehydrogenase